MIDPADAEQYFALLTDLLAVIHGDGGHHAHQHGLEESCRQAHLSLTRLRDELHRLRWGVAANAGCRSTEPAPRWAHVVKMTGLGSTSAHQLCHAAGFDPEEIVGKAQEEQRDALREKVVEQAKRIEKLRASAEMYRARLKEVMVWVGRTPYRNTKYFTEMILVKELAEDALEEEIP